MVYFCPKRRGKRGSEAVGDGEREGPTELDRQVKVGEGRRG